MPDHQDTRLRVVVFSPSPTRGMSHFAHGIADAMRGSADVTVLDAAEGIGVFSMWRRLRRLVADRSVSVLNTSPHWSAPLLLQWPGIRGGHVWHDPILVAPSRRMRLLHVAYYRMVTRRLPVVVVHAEAFRENVRRYRLPARAVVVVPHGFVPSSLDSELPYDPAGPIALLGRLLPYKGGSVLMEALRLLAAEGKRVEAIVGGEGVSELNVPDEIRSSVRLYTGTIPDADFARMCGECSAIVLPYTHATQSGVLATAFRAGRPVIASALGSFPEYIREEENGLLVPPRDPRALADAIDRLRNDHSLARKMAEGARRSWETEYDPRIAAEKIARALSDNV